MDQADAGAAAGITADAITRLSGPLPASCRCQLKVLVSEEAGSWMVEASATRHPGQFRPDIYDLLRREHLLRQLRCRVDIPSYIDDSGPIETIYIVRYRS